MIQEEMYKIHNAAIVLAAGQGKRMRTKVQKQFLEVEGKPVLYYSLETFEQSPIIDEVVLVVGDGLVDYCQKEIIDKYHFHKVKKIVLGGKERYESVFGGLRALMESAPEYVFIHDGARPFVDCDMLKRAYNEVVKTKACVVGMPSKDTIKVVNKDGVVVETPDRKYLWQIQTPQVFSFDLIREAYFELMKQEVINVTDDAMVLETVKGMAVKLVEGSYENIKITTPEDLFIATAFLKKRKIKEKDIDKFDDEC